MNKLPPVGLGIEAPQGVVAYSKGAPEVMLDSCTRIYVNNV